MRRKTKLKSTRKTNDREELGEEKQCVSPQAATHLTGEPQENDVKMFIYVFIIYTVLKIKPLEPCPCQQVPLVATSLVAALLFSNTVFPCVLLFRE